MPWARLKYGGTSKVWHAIRGLWAICGALHFDYPRVERSAGAPGSGRLCKRCVAKLAKAHHEPHLFTEASAQ
jgi:hypothetical protein